MAHIRRVDDTGLVIKAQGSDWPFVDSPKGQLGLVECQKLPRLFDRIKLNVDKNFFFNEP